MSYQGYANYETWAVALWIDNDEGLYEQRKEMVADCVSRAREGSESWAVADALKNWIEDLKPELDGLWADLLSGALSEVDWTELAEGWIAEQKEDES